MLRWDSQLLLRSATPFPAVVPTTCTFAYPTLLCMCTLFFPISRAPNDTQTDIVQKHRIVIFCKVKSKVYGCIDLHSFWPNKTLFVLMKTLPVPQGAQEECWRFCRNHQKTRLFFLLLPFPVISPPNPCFTTASIYSRKRLFHRIWENMIAWLNKELN